MFRNLKKKTKKKLNWKKKLKIIFFLVTPISFLPFTPKSILFLLCPLETLVLPTLGTFFGNASIPNGEHCFTDLHHAFVVSEVCAWDEEILSEDGDDFGNGRRAPVSDDDNNKEQEVDVETTNEKHLRIAKAYIDRTHQAVADAVVHRRLSFFLSPNFQFPPLL